MQSAADMLAVKKLVTFISLLRAGKLRVLGTIKRFSFFCPVFKVSSTLYYKCLSAMRRSLPLCESQHVILKTIFINFVPLSVTGRVDCPPPRTVTVIIDSWVVLCTLTYQSNRHQSPTLKAAIFFLMLTFFSKKYFLIKKSENL